MKRVWLLLVAVALVGCGGDKRDELVGTWPGTVSVNDEAVTAELGVARAATGRSDITKEQVKVIMEAMACSLTLNDDGTYTMTLMGAAHGGKWSFDSKKVGLSPETLNGLPIQEAAAQLKLDPMETSHMSEPLWLYITEDGKSLSCPAPPGPGYALVFSKP